MRTSAAILDGDDLSRNGIAAILAKTLPEVYIEAALNCSGNDLESLLRTKHLQILLIHDTPTSSHELYHTLDRVRTIMPSTANIVMSTRLVMSYIEQLLERGVKGYIYSGEPLEEILPLAFRSVLRGDVYLSPRAALLPYRGGFDAETGLLTQRELAVLHYLYDGFTVAEIAISLGVERKSVYRARDRLRLMLGVRTNEQIVPAAAARGLL